MKNIYKYCGFLIVIISLAANFGFGGILFSLSSASFFDFGILYILFFIAEFIIITPAIIILPNKKINLFILISLVFLFVGALQSVSPVSIIISKYIFLFFIEKNLFILIFVFLVIYSLNHEKQKI